MLRRVVKLVPSSLIFIDEVIRPVHIRMIDDFERISVDSSNCVLFDMPMLTALAPDDGQRLAKLANHGPDFLLSQHDVLVLSG